MWQGGCREGHRLRSSLAAGIVPWGFCWEPTGEPSVLPLSLPQRQGCSQWRDVSKHILFLIPWCWEGRVDLSLCAEAWLSQLLSLHGLVLNPFPSWFYFLSDASQLHGKGSNAQQRKL